MAEIMEEFACEAPGSALKEADLHHRAPQPPGFQKGC
jgi:hypothetical protein